MSLLSYQLMLCHACLQYQLYSLHYVIFVSMTKLFLDFTINESIFQLLDVLLFMFNFFLKHSN